jgi:hypothetical protein
VMHSEGVPLVHDHQRYKEISKINGKKEEKLKYYVRKTSLLESSCKCFSINFSTNFLVENLTGKLMEFCSCTLEKSTKKLEIDHAINITPINVL